MTATEFLSLVSVQFNRDTGTRAKKILVSRDIFYMLRDEPEANERFVPFDRPAGPLRLMFKAAEVSIYPGPIQKYECFVK